MRFPDGSVSAACEHLVKNPWGEKGVKSTTSGCLPLAAPFALAYPDMNEACERAVRAANVTHTHPVADAAVSTFVTLLYHSLHETPDAIERAVQKALVEDEVLGGKIRNALALEKDGMETETALLKIGNDVSVFQTLPIAFFLISRYTHPPDLLTVAANTAAIPIPSRSSAVHISGLPGAWMRCRRICSKDLKTGTDRACSASGSTTFVARNSNKSCPKLQYTFLPSLPEGRVKKD